MVFRWLRNLRRDKILETPFPEDWRDIVETNVAHWALLDDAEREQLCELVQVFVAEKDWEGCNGLELTDEIRVTIAAEACLLVLGLSHDLYRKVDSILVYPSTVVIPERQPGFFEVPGQLARGPTPILGEARRGGPIILTWDAVRRGARHPERGHNVVYHEFAHALDMLDDSYADGTPTLDGREEYARWGEVCDDAYARLHRRTKRGKQTVLDEYGTTNEAEFFAVATEAFFATPAALKREEPALYSLLSDFYCQDPASREERTDAEPPV